MNSYSYEECLRCYHKLRPILQFTEKMLFKPELSVGGEKWNFDLQLEWMGENRFKFCHRNFSRIEKTIKKPSQILLSAQHSSCHGLENALMLTALADKALANVYCTASGEKLAPHLLKDLIGSQELKRVFGTDAASKRNICHLVF